MPIPGDLSFVISAMKLCSMTRASPSCNKGEVTLVAFSLVLLLPTLVNVYVDLLVFTRIAGTS